LAKWSVADGAAFLHDHRLAWHTHDSDVHVLRFNRNDAICLVRRGWLKHRGLLTKLFVADAVDISTPAREKKVYVRTRPLCVECVCGWMKEGELAAMKRLRSKLL
jgi:hypothetical protein